MNGQTDATNTNTTLKFDIPTALHMASTADRTELRAFGALAAAVILFRNIDWPQFSKDPSYQEYAELCQQLHEDISNSIESGFGHSDSDDVAKGGAA